LTAAAPVSSDQDRGGAQRHLRRKHDPLDKSRRIVDATLQTIARVGYTKATVREICLAADVSVGTFYEHFESKSHLLGQAATRARTLRFTPDDLLDVAQTEARLADYLWGPTGALWRSWREALIAEPSLESQEQRLSQATRTALSSAVGAARKCLGRSSTQAELDEIAWAIHALVREAFRRAGGQPERMERTIARTICLLVNDGG